MSEPNVNPSGNVSSEINIKRLGSQQKEILRLFYREGKVYQQTGIIEEIYGEVNNSKKASVSRSISKLREKDLVFEQNALYYPNMDAWCKARPHYGITDEGEAFLEADERFPDIGGGDDE